MWVGMMPDSDPQKARMLNRFKPMATFTEKTVIRRKKWMWLRGKRRVKDRSVFLPPCCPFYKTAMRRPFSASAWPITFRSDAYYNYVLTLFGQGWDQHRFRFSTKGELLPDWGQECANSH